MNTDGRINRNLSNPPFVSAGESFLGQDRRAADERWGNPAFGKDMHGEPDRDAEERLRRALERPAAEADTVLPDSTMGSMLPPPRLGQAPVAEATAQSEVAARVSDLVDRLMVDVDGSNRQVRIDLKDSALPGVTLVIQEHEGRLQVDFVCREEPVRVQLNREADGHAALLATRLRREVLLRVMADDEEFPCVHEVAAQP